MYNKHLVQYVEWYSSPELYGRKQLGLYSNFFMNLMDPVSVRQNNERSPKINIESGAFELLKTKMSTACSPILNDQSICEGKKKDRQIVEYYMPQYKSMHTYNDWSILKAIQYFLDP